MRTGQTETAQRRSVGAQFVGDQQFRRETLLLEQLAHQPQRRPGVASALDQHVEDLALVVDGLPQIHPLAGCAEARREGRPTRAPTDLGEPIGYVARIADPRRQLARTVLRAGGRACGGIAGRTVRPRPEEEATRPVENRNPRQPLLGRDDAR